MQLSSLLLRDRKEIEVIQMCQHMSHSVIFQPEKYKVKLHLVTTCESRTVEITARVAQSLTS